MLDNLTDAEMREAVVRIAGRAKVEISGRVTLDRIPALAAIGADVVSVGALTHSAPAADISLEMPADAGSAAR
jgi:nicotinate-nucleotide pyrophosphorylase (carboxylating)